MARVAGRECRVLVVASVVTLLVGCATLRIGSYVAPGTDFAYRSYSWAPTDRLSTGDPRLDNNPFFQKRLVSGVERRLGDRGFEQRESGGADLVVHYHASVGQRISVHGVDKESAICEPDDADCRPFVYDAGTIVLDLVDARTNRLVWRGWAEGSLEGIIDDQERMEQQVDEAVMRIMERLPRSPLQTSRGASAEP